MLETLLLLLLLLEPLPSSRRSHCPSSSSPKLSALSQRSSPRVATCFPSSFPSCNAFAFDATLGDLGSIIYSHESTNNLIFIFSTDVDYDHHKSFTIQNCEKSILVRTFGWVRYLRFDSRCGSCRALVNERRLRIPRLIYYVRLLDVAHKESNLDKMSLNHFPYTFPLVPGTDMIRFRSRLCRQNGTLQTRAMKSARTMSSTSWTVTIQQSLKQEWRGIALILNGLIATWEIVYSTQHRLTHIYRQHPQGVHIEIQMASFFDKFFFLNLPHPSPHFLRPPAPCPPWKCQSRFFPVKR